MVTVNLDLSLRFELIYYIVSFFLVVKIREIRRFIRGNLRRFFFQTRLFDRIYQIE